MMGYDADEDDDDDDENDDDGDCEHEHPKHSMLSGRNAYTLHF